MHRFGSLIWGWSASPAFTFLALCAGQVTQSREQLIFFWRWEDVCTVASASLQGWPRGNPLFCLENGAEV